MRARTKIALDSLDRNLIFSGFSASPFDIVRLYHEFFSVEFQLEVEARRQFEVNVQIARTFVNITVIRNENAPRFRSSEYRIDALSEKTAVGTALLEVSATDEDEVCRSEPRAFDKTVKNP